VSYAGIFIDTRSGARSFVEIIPLPSLAALAAANPPPLGPREPSPPVLASTPHPDTTPGPWSQAARSRAIADRGCLDRADDCRAGVNDAILTALNHLGPPGVGPFDVFNTAVLANHPLAPGQPAPSGPATQPPALPVDRSVRPMSDLLPGG
jgi:hypothetical protein